MTTVDKAHLLLMSFQGKSLRSIYKDECAKVGAKVNQHLAAELSDEVNAFENENFDVSAHYLGPKGSLALLPLLQCQQRLAFVNFSSIGVDDGMVVQLVEILTDHPRIRYIDLSNNKDISVYSGKHCVRVMQLNINIVGLVLTNTRVGDNVAEMLRRKGEKNSAAMESYFSNDYFKMKDVFTGLDVDGSGWVHINSVVGNIVYPMIREKLQRRIDTMRIKKRADNCINLDTFFRLAFIGYKQKEDIQLRLGEEEKSYRRIGQNWVALQDALRNQGATCDDLYKARVRTVALTEENANTVVAKAVEIAGSKAISAKDIWAARRSIGSLSPRGRQRKSFLAADSGVAWSLPVPLVRDLHAFYEQREGKAATAEELLGQRFETELEWLNTDFLRNKFRSVGMPLEDTTLDLSEAVNMFDEYYDACRVNKNVTDDVAKQFMS
jgi:hypothetical protein